MLLLLLPVLLLHQLLLLLVLVWASPAGKVYLHAQCYVGQRNLLGDLHSHSQAGQVYQLEARVLLCVDPQAPLQHALLRCEQHIALGVSILISTLHNTSITANPLVTGNQCTLPDTETVHAAVLHCYRQFAEVQVTGLTPLCAIMAAAVLTCSTCAVAASTRLLMLSYSAAASCWCCAARVLHASQVAAYAAASHAAGAAAGAVAAAGDSGTVASASPSSVSVPGSCSTSVLTTSAAWASALAAAPLLLAA
jgi:hypothetical protein